MSSKVYQMILFIWGLLVPLAKIYAQDAPEDMLHDPTEPASYSEKTITRIPNSDINISAIFANNTDHKIVMIGNHMFTIGEKISGLTIVAIDNKGITLKKDDGSEFRVELPYPTVKTPPNNRKETK